MHSIISLIVQEYFCYRIWTLNKRLSWLCVIIAIVRSFFILLPSKSRHDLAWIQIGVIQSIGAAWGGIMASIISLFLVVHF
jgi:glucose uptake protein GlcU